MSSLAEPSMSDLSSLAIRHLLLRLKPLNRALAKAVDQQRTLAAQLARPDFSSLCLTDEHVKLLLQRAESAQSSGSSQSCGAWLDAKETRAEEELRAQAENSKTRLPLDQLAQDLDLTAFEQEAALLCVAPELDRTYESIYGFILDDLNRRFPCLELLISLTAISIEDRIHRRHILSSCGRLRRSGVLIPFGQPATDLRQEFRLGPQVFEYLTGSGLNAAQLYRDRSEVFVPETAECPLHVTQDLFAHFVDALRTESVAIVAIWGPRKNGAVELVRAFASAMRRSLRQLSVFDLEETGIEPTHVLQEQLRIAAGLGSLLWFDTDGLGDTSHNRIQYLLERAFADCPVPLLLTGERPWRREPLLRTGRYAEIELSEPTLHHREQLWSHNFPELRVDEIEELAARYSVGGADIHSISRLARTRARLAGNGQPDPVGKHVNAASAVITRRASSHFTTAVSPRRGPEDLVLRPDLHSQVIEVATFFRLHQRVDEDWGFGHLASGTGMKALFTGEPGTGKTLAAEVIAGLLRVPLYKVDLARIVSKWVGETEKNLESAFREAEENHAVLFFDEAEALFGKRAEVQHGTDRYANLEISYLLQRLESSSGLVILASNVKDQIDSAFVRRFHVVVHFPKPGPEERRRIWERAFPQSAPVNPDVDLDALARLDMTGSAIVTTARSAALLAADAGSSTISMADVIGSTSRQYRREARVLTASDLGCYGSLLQGAP